MYSPYYARFDRCWNSGSASETEPVLTARCRYVQPTVFVCQYSPGRAQVLPSAANLRFWPIWAHLGN